MTDGENPHFFFDHLEHDTVVADAQFPVALERFSQGFTVIMGRGLQPLFDCLLNSVFRFSIDKGQILVPYGGMIAQRENHGSFPHIFV